MEIIIQLIVLAVLLTLAYGGLSAAPWVPTRKYHVERAMKLADLKPGETFVDLGCGDGRLVAAAAELGNRAIGYEVALLPYVLAKIRTWRFRDRTIIRYKSLWNADLREADVVYMFLMPESTQKLREKMDREMKPGSRVISYVWKMKDWEPMAVDSVKNDLKFYLYAK